MNSRLSFFAKFSMLSLVFLLTACGERDTKYDALAQCLDESGAKFYGAFWCPNCTDQKDLFGDSEDLLPYIECEQGGKNANPALCKAENITAYPTWKFAGGRVVTGKQSLEDLADFSSCALPEGDLSIMRQ